MGAKMLPAYWYLNTCFLIMMLTLYPNNQLNSPLFLWHQVQTSLELVYYHGTRCFLAPFQI